jgi:hypothetical protein
MRDPLRSKPGYQFVTLVLDVIAFPTSSATSSTAVSKDRFGFRNR